MPALPIKTERPFTISHRFSERPMDGLLTNTSPPLSLVPRIWSNFKLTFTICFLCIAMMVVFTTPAIPYEWRIFGWEWALIIPLALNVGCHILLPVSTSSYVYPSSLDLRRLFLGRPQPLVDDLLILRSLSSLHALEDLLDFCRPLSRPTYTFSSSHSPTNHTPLPHHIKHYAHHHHTTFMILISTTTKD